MRRAAGPLLLVTVALVLADSAIVTLALPDELAAAANALGLGRDLDLGIPAFLGSVPTDADGTERAASMIGQGRIEASPLAMAVVAAVTPPSAPC